MRLRMPVSVAILATAGTIAAATATADETWKTITIAGKPDFTIDIPTGVEPETGLPKDVLMAFFGLSGDDHLFCELLQQKYSKTLPRAKMIDGLATPARAVYCGESDKSLTGFQLLASESTSSNNFPAAKCASSYTKASEDHPGVAQATLLVVAPKELYILTCTVNDDDETSATIAYAGAWGDEVNHIRDSLHLPKTAK
jgi:hypothetical protein